MNKGQRAKIRLPKCWLGRSSRLREQNTGGQNVGLVDAQTRRNTT